MRFYIFSLNPKEDDGLRNKNILFFRRDTSLIGKLEKIQYGTARVANLATKKNGTIAITFPKSYTNAPTVVASLNHSFVDTCQVAVYDISKTGCTLAVYNGSAVANTYDITWVAIGT